MTATHFFNRGRMPEALLTPEFQKNTVWREDARTVCQHCVSIRSAVGSSHIHIAVLDPTLSNDAIEATRVIESDFTLHMLGPSKTVPFLHKSGASIAHHESRSNLIEWAGAHEQLSAIFAISEASAGSAIAALRPGGLLLLASAAPISRDDFYTVAMLDGVMVSPGSLLLQKEMH